MSPASATAPAEPRRSIPGLIGERVMSRTGEEAGGMLRRDPGSGPGMRLPGPGMPIRPSQLTSAEVAAETVL